MSGGAIPSRRILESHFRGADAGLAQTHHHTWWQHGHRVLADAAPTPTPCSRMRPRADQCLGHERLHHHSANGTNSITLTPPPAIVLPAEAVTGAAEGCRNCFAPQARVKIGEQLTNEGEIFGRPGRKSGMIRSFCLVFTFCLLAAAPAFAGLKTATARLPRRQHVVQDQRRRQGRLAVRGRDKLKLSAHATNACISCHADVTTKHPMTISCSRR